MILTKLERLLTLCGLGTKTVRMSDQFGPPPGAVYARELAAYTDLELIARDRADVLAEVRAQRAARDARLRGSRYVVANRKAAAK